MGFINCLPFCRYFWIQCIFSKTDFGIESIGSSQSSWVPWILWFEDILLMKVLCHLLKEKGVGMNLRITFISLDPVSIYNSWLGPFSYLIFWYHYKPYCKANLRGPLLKKGPSVRAAYSDGTREPSSQKQFGLAESVCGFKILTKLNSKMFLNSFKN